MGYELTNDQRICFGLAPVQGHWQVLQLPTPEHLGQQVFCYLQENRIKKAITVGDNFYQESDLDAPLREDLRVLLPDLEEEARPLSSWNVALRKGAGPTLRFGHGNITLTHGKTGQVYYTSVYAGIRYSTMEDFAQWVRDWCQNTTLEDLRALEIFARGNLPAQSYGEGDVFRIPYGQHRYAYGRVLVDYEKLRQEILYLPDFHPESLLVVIYPLITEDPQYDLNRLEQLSLLPALRMDPELLANGTFSVVGHGEVDLEQVDCPIYHSLLREMPNTRQTTCYYLRGKTFRTRPGEPLQHGDGISYGIRVLERTLSFLPRCIQAGSSDPLWEKLPRRDLRNPKNKFLLQEIQRYMGEVPRGYLKETRDQQLRQMLQSGEMAQFTLACQLLVRQKDPEAFALLAPFLDHKDAYRRRAVAQCIWSLPESQALIPKAETILREDSWYVVSALLTAVYRFHLPIAPDLRLQAMVRHLERLSSSELWALQNLPRNEQGLQVLLALYRALEGKDCRYYVLSTLLMEYRDQYFDQVFPVLADCLDPHIRRQAVRMAGLTGRLQELDRFKGDLARQVRGARDTFLRKYGMASGGSGPL